MKSPEIQMPRESAVSKVVGGDTKDERATQEFFRHVFEHQPIAMWERPKTTEEMELIKEINQRLKDFVKKYGGEWIEVKPENVHIIAPEKLNEVQKQEAAQARWGAYYDSDKQGVVVFANHNLDQRLLHEMLHLNSFSSFDLSRKTKGDRGAERRSGLEVTVDIDKKDVETGREIFFSELNEAVIAELQVRFTKKNWPGLFECPYKEERVVLRALIKEIYKKNRKDFKSEEDIFKLFANATIGGQLLPLARAIEKTYGQGSFRYLGDLTKSRNSMGLDETTINLDDV